MNKLLVKMSILLFLLLVNQCIYAEEPQSRDIFLPQITAPSSTQLSLPLVEAPPGLPPVPEPYGRSQCHRKGFHCVVVPPGANWFVMFPISWQRNIVMRLNRTNVDIRYRTWLIVPDNWNHFDYLSAAPFPDHITAPGEPEIIVDLSRFAFATYSALGYLVYWGPAAGGRKWCDETHSSCLTATGTFRIYRIQGADCMSTEFDQEDKLNAHGGAPMPYCMHFKNGWALHGSTVSGFVNRSHGCVRLFNEDAKWLNQQFVQIGTRVIVHY